MTNAPAAAGQPGRDDLIMRIFRALYQQFDLHTIDGTYVVVPKGTPWYAGPLSATSPARSATTTTRARPLPQAGPGKIAINTSSRGSSAAPSP